MRHVHIAKAFMVADKSKDEKRQRVEDAKIRRVVERVEVVSSAASQGV